MADVQTELLITVEEAARRLSVSRSMIYKLMNGKSLETVKIGRSRRIRAESLESYVESIS